MQESNTKAAPKPTPAAAEPHPASQGLTNTPELARALNKWLETQAHANGPVTVAGWANQRLATSIDYLRVNIDVSIHSQLDESHLGEITFRASGGDIHASTTSERIRLPSGDILQLPPAGAVHYDPQHGLGPVPATPAAQLQVIARWLTLYMREAAAMIRKSTDRPGTAQAAAEPGTSTSQYRAWFEKQLQPGARRDDISLRYRGMDLTLVSSYTSNQNGLRYSVFHTGREPAFVVNFSRSGAEISTPGFVVGVGAALDFQRTMLAVLKEFDAKVQAYISRQLREFVFYEAVYDVRGEVNGDKLHVTITPTGAIRFRDAVTLDFPVSQLREWIWSPGRRGWHETLLGLCQEAWNSYQTQKTQEH